MKAILALIDGTVYEGRAFGASGTTWGEVVFNTGMTGYQEILTDPSYAGQIVTLTYPLVGNYGTDEEFTESGSPKVRGFIVREAFTRGPRFEAIGSRGGRGEGSKFGSLGLRKDKDSSWREDKKQLGDEIRHIAAAEIEKDSSFCADYVWEKHRKALDKYLKENNVIAIEGIDTRSLTRKIRRYGVMKGAISTEYSGEELLCMLRNFPEVESLDLVGEVTTKKPYTVSGGIGPCIALLDLGAKKDIIESLAKRGCRVSVLPADTPAEKILTRNFDGVLLSNGPGDPKRAAYAVNTTRKLLGMLPIFGICLGHQILALALGGDTYKLKFGHRGANHPVKDIKKDRVFMTSQNHGYAVDESSLKGRANVTFINVNDDTVEGLEVPGLDAFSVQFHPEASPGPTDAAYLFDEFLARVKAGARNKSRPGTVNIGAGR